MMAVGKKSCDDY